MMIPNNSLSKIKKLADDISSYYTDKITSLELIAEYEGLEIFYDSYEKGTFDGMTIYDNGTFYIHINTDNGNKKGSGRSRFTLAHELGHYFIDSHRVGLKNGLLEPHPSKIDRVQFDRIEQEADYFAACLIMPEELFKKDALKKRKFNFQIIKDLSKEYNVSITACAIRFSEIGNIPIKIIYAETGEIKWSKNSIDFPYYKLITDGKIIPEGLIMYDYFKNTTEEIEKTEEIWASLCFDNVKSSDFQRKFYEHCITYKNRALSIIWED